MVIKVAWPATSPSNKKKQGLQPRKRSRDMSAEAQVRVSVNKESNEIPRFSMVIIHDSCEYHVWIFWGFLRIQCYVIWQELLATVSPAAWQTLTNRLNGLNAPWPL